MQWVFDELSKIKHEDPSDAESLKDDQGDGEEYAHIDSLIRETIQNSVDAAVKNESNVVRVRISLHDEKDCPSPDRSKMYFERLKEPLKVMDISYNLHGVPDLKGRFLVCEDFGTRGLVGDPKFNDICVDENDLQDLYWFFINRGRTGKKSDALGSRGIGKSVFQMASKIKCMFGLTIRESGTPRCLVMGRSALKIHSFENKRWEADGLWCEGRDSNSGIPIPIENEEYVELFRKEWKLTRTNEPGLSVVVPYVHNLTGKSIFQAVAVNFFSLILLQKLIVEIKTPEFEEVVLTHETIEEACRKIV